MSDQSMSRLIGGGIVVLTLIVGTLPSISMAQQYYDPGLLQKTVDRKPIAYQSPGIRAGSFNLNTGAELAWEYNDNIYFMREHEISDNIIHARPWLNLNSDWSRHALNLSTFADVASYNDYNDQNYTDAIINLDGRVDVKRGSMFNYKASYMNLHEDRSDLNSRSGIEPTTYDISALNVDYMHNFNRLTAILRYRYHEVDYDNGKGFAGEVIYNQDRDRSRDTWSMRMDYDYSEQSRLFVEYAGNKVDYDQTFDNNGYQRSSDGYDLRGGVSWSMTGVLVGELFLQYVSQDYDDPSFKMVDGFGVGANLDWTPTRLTSVNIRFANTPMETTRVGYSGYYSSLYSVRLQHELRRNILFNARVSYTDNDYQKDDLGTGDLDYTKVSRAGVGMSYLMNRNFYLSGGYVYEKQRSNLDRYEYMTNRFFITLGGEF